MLEEMDQVIAEAARVLDRGWTQGAYARDRGGSIVKPGSPDAVCWCAEGAIHVAAASVLRRQLLMTAVPWTASYLAVMALKRVCAHITPDRCRVETQRLSEFNDTPGRTREEVQALLRDVVTT